MKSCDVEVAPIVALYMQASILLFDETLFEYLSRPSLNITMHFLGNSSSSSMSEFEPIATTQYAQQIVSGAARAAGSFPGCSGRRISGQLVPITVVGMGDLL